MTILEAALLYANKGMSVIPIGFDKKPIIDEWKPYQDTKATTETIRQWWKEHPRANIGIVTGAISNLLVIDCDTPEAIQRIQEAIPDSMTVPCEHTPRGGMHFFFSHTEGYSNRAKVADGIDIRTTGGYCAVSPSVNGTGKGWEWVVSMLEVDPPEIALGIKDIIKDSFSLLYRGVTNGKQQSVTSVTNRNIFFMEGTRDEDLFHTANCLLKGGMDLQMASQVLETLAKSCDPPFPIREAEEKIKSALQRNERRELTLTEEIRRWVSVTNGNFSVTEALQDVTIRNKDDRAKVRVYLSRMVEHGDIERVSGKNGWFRKVEKKIEKMEWMTLEDTPIKINWPFSIQDLFRCYPKNVILIAGSPDAGKTAFCLDFCKRNLEKHEIHYFSSEMGPLELKVRAAKFDMPFENWDKVNFYERTHDWADVIQPDAVNIIDYLLVPEEAWKIALPIRQVFDKLNKGIAIIALQKPMLRDIARGGESTLDIPRLYLSMGSGVIKIVKCKNWANPERNPNGLSREFSIVQGAKITNLSDWGIPSSEIRR